MPKKENNKKWGGKRQGSGRPGLEGAKNVLTVKLTPAQFRKLENIRKRLDLSSMSHVVRYLVDSANLITNNGGR